jgi:hypothetical protein
MLDASFLSRASQNMVGNVDGFSSPIHFISWTSATLFVSTLSEITKDITSEKDAPIPEEIVNPHKLVASTTTIASFGYNLKLPYDQHDGRSAVLLPRHWCAKDAIYGWNPPKMGRNQGGSGRFEAENEIRSGWVRVGG